LIRSVLYIAILLICSFNSSAQSNLTIAHTGISKGDAEQIASVCAKSVELTFSHKAKTYSKDEAEIILKKFFTKNDPKSYRFSPMQKSRSNNTIYAMGRMTTNSANFRVYLFFIPKGKEYILKELRIETPSSDFAFNPN